MHKRFFKAVAILACLGILSLAVTPVFAADKKAPKYGDKSFLKVPLNILSSFLPIFAGLIKGKKADINTDKGKKVKLTGGLKSGQVSDGD